MRLPGYLLISLIIFMIPVYSKTIHVPADYTKIQDAIDAAVNGDTVLVQPGSYLENLDYKGKAISVESSQGAAMTVIDGYQSGTTVVTFQTGEGPSSVLEGFTITNGDSGYGGGILCNKSSPTITLCNILNNTANYEGGGIYCYDTTATVVNTTIIGNTAYYLSGGICCDGNGFH